MSIGQLCHLAASGGTFDEALLDEERFIDLLHRTAVLANGCGDGVDAHWAATELIDDGEQDLIVYLVQTVAVDVQRLECHPCDTQVDASVALHLGKITHTAQQGIGDTRRAAAAAGYLAGGLYIYGEPQDAGTAGDDLLQRGGIVVFQVQVDAEAGTERCRKQSAARGGSDEGEGVQVDLNTASRGPLVYHDVDAIVLHGRVEILLHDGREAMNLIDEEHIVRLQTGQDACQVSGLVQHRTAGELESHAQLVGNDIAQGGLAQSWRAMKQRMVERLATITSCLHEDAKVVHHLLLSAEILKAQGAQGILKVLLLHPSFFADVKGASLMRIFVCHTLCQFIIDNTRFNTGLASV